MRNLFTNIGSGAIVRVDRVDDSYATVITVYPKPAKYMMPKKEYDTVFVRQFRPSTIDDLARLDEEFKDFKLPDNAPDSWK